MVVGRVAPLLATGLLAVPLAGCSKRTVYLVPALEAVTVDAGGRPPPPPADGGHHLPTGIDASVGEPPDAPGYDGGRLACETMRVQRQPEPLGIYVMMDKSNTMVAPWLEVSRDLQQFIGQLDAYRGISVGIQFYPLVPPITVAPTAMCEPSQYATPETPIDVLPDNELALVASINNHNPNVITAWVTPTESPTDIALQGAIVGARAWAKQHEADRAKAVVLLVTTGVPSSVASPVCLPTVAAAQAVAKDGVSSTSGEPSVPTYVLAVGTASDDLNAIASSGGTGEAFLKSSGGTLLDVLLRIRDLALPCDVDVGGADLGGDRVNVELDAPGVPAARYGRVGGLADCSRVQPGAGAWYVDGAAPTPTLRLCPSTCAAARSVAGATLEVISGCLTYSAPIQ